MGEREKAGRAYVELANNPIRFKLHSPGGCVVPLRPLLVCSGKSRPQQRIDIHEGLVLNPNLLLLGLNSHLTLYTCPSSTAAIVQGVRDDQKEVCFDRVTKYMVVCQLRWVLHYN